MPRYFWLQKASQEFLCHGYRNPQNALYPLHGKYPLAFLQRRNLHGRGSPCNGCFLAGYGWLPGRRLKRFSIDDNCQYALFYNPCFTSQLVGLEGKRLAGPDGNNFLAILFAIRILAYARNNVMTPRALVPVADAIGV